MKTLIFIILLIPPHTRADIVIKVLAKYGVSGYNVTNTSSNTTYAINKKKSFSINSTGATSINETKDISYGLGLEYIPENSHFTLGGGLYQDETLTVEFGYRF